MVKIVTRQQEKLINTCKNTKHKLLKTNTAIWFNKIYRAKQLQPHYINIWVNGHNQHSQWTTQVAYHFKIMQEVKFLHCNTRLKNAWYNAQDFYWNFISSIKLQ
jgi:hypothetical protein